MGTGALPCSCALFPPPNSWMYVGTVQIVVNSFYDNMIICLYVYMFNECCRVDISILVRLVVICYGSDTIEYDRRTSELSNTPLHKK